MVGIELSHLCSPSVASPPDMTPSIKPGFGHPPQDTVSVHIFSLISSHFTSNPHAPATWISSEIPLPALNQLYFFCRSAQLWPIFTCLILLIFDTHFNPHSQALRWPSYHSCLLLCSLCSPLPKSTACTDLLWCLLVFPIGFHTLLTDVCIQQRQNSLNIVKII